MYVLGQKSPSLILIMRAQMIIVFALAAFNDRNSCMCVCVCMCMCESDREGDCESVYV